MPQRSISVITTTTQRFTHVYMQHLQQTSTFVIAENRTRNMWSGKQTNQSFDHCHTDIYKNCKKQNANANGRNKHNQSQDAKTLSTAMYPNAAHSLGDSTLYDGIQSQTRGNRETKNERSYLCQLQHNLLPKEKKGPSKLRNRKSYHSPSLQQSGDAI